MLVLWYLFIHPIEKIFEIRLICSKWRYNGNTNHMFRISILLCCFNSSLQKIIKYKMKNYRRCNLLTNTFFVRRFYDTWQQSYIRCKKQTKCTRKKKCWIERNRLLTWYIIEKTSLRVSAANIFHRNCKHKKRYMNQKHRALNLWPRKLFDCSQKWTFNDKAFVYIIFYLNAIICLSCN